MARTGGVLAPPIGMQDHSRRGASRCRRHAEAASRSATSMVSLMAHPTVRRLARSSTITRKSQPSTWAYSQVTPPVKFRLTIRSDRSGWMESVVRTTRPRGRAHLTLHHGGRAQCFAMHTSTFRNPLGTRCARRGCGTSETRRAQARVVAHCAPTEAPAPRRAAPGRCNSPHTRASGGHLLQGCIAARRVRE